MILRVIGAVAALLAAAAVSIVLLLWAQHNEAVTLPALTGPYPVGRTAFDWMEPRTEDLAPEMHAKRELTVWIWYPAFVDKSSVVSEYIPRPWRVALARRQGPVMTNFMKHDTSLVRSHSFANADIAPGQRTYPVILMKPGIGALALDYTTLAEDIASHGYIVVASDSPYSTFLVVFHNGRVAERRRAANAGENAPITEQNRVGNRIINTWVGDERFLLDHLTRLNTSRAFGRFRGRLNLHAVGVIGHSFGGATAAEFCFHDPRCKAGVDMDGIPFGQIVHKKLNHPFMFLMSDHSKEHDLETKKITQEIQSIYGRLPYGRQLVMIRNSGHFSFSDQPLIFNHAIARMSGITGSIDPTRGLAAAASTVEAFLDVHLKGASPSKIRALKERYPELVFANDSNQ